MGDRDSRALQMAVAVVGAGVMLWAEMPDWQRRQLAMSAARMVTRWTGRPWRGAALAGMRAELRAGCEQAALPQYAAAYYLGRLRERAEAFYEDMRAS